MQEMENGRISSREMRCRAVKEYHGKSDKELTFSIGEEIKIIDDKIEPGWLKGELNGKTGIFPVDFCEYIDNPNETTENKIKRSKSRSLINSDLLLARLQIIRKDNQISELLFQLDEKNKQINAISKKLQDKNKKVHELHQKDKERIDECLQLTARVQIIEEKYEKLVRLFLLPFLSFENSCKISA